MTLEGRLKQLKAIRKEHIHRLKYLDFEHSDYFSTQDLLHCIIVHNARIDEVKYLLKLKKGERK